MNAFERLGLPLQLVIEKSVLEARLREVSQQAHPDRGGDEEAFQAARKAGEALKSPAGRLGAALEVVGTDSAARGAIPSELMDFFSPVAEGLQAVDAFVKERSQAKSGLGKAVLDVRVPVLKQELERLVSGLADLEEGYLGRFAEFDDCGWEVSRGEMEEVRRALVFLGKWQAQLREANGKIFEALLGG